MVLQIVHNVQRQHATRRPHESDFEPNADLLFVRLRIQVKDLVDFHVLEVLVLLEEYQDAEAQAEKGYDSSQKGRFGD